MVVTFSHGGEIFFIRCYIYMLRIFFTLTKLIQSGGHFLRVIKIETRQQLLKIGKS